MEKPKVQIVLEELLTGAVEKLTSSNNGGLTGALMVHFDMDEGEAAVYDEAENLLEKLPVFDWEERAEKGARLYKQGVHFTRVVTAAMKGRKAFDNPVFLRPFRVAIVDDNFKETETVFTLDSVDGPSEGRLMKNLEHELQNFSKKIFAELE